MERHADMVRTACGFMDDERAALTGRQIAAAVGLSPSQFYKIFRRITGMTPAAYARLSGRAPRHDPPVTSQASRSGERATWPNTTP